MATATDAASLWLIHPRRWVVGAAAVIAVAVAAVAAVGIHWGAPRGVPAEDVRTYVAEVEAVRLPVNQLLAEADPILGARRRGTMTADAAAAAMDALERRFAAYATQVTAIAPKNPTLRRLQTPYAATYLMEDSYLSALAADVQTGSYDDLPTTENQQRLAIVTWRVGLEVVAQQSGLRLPADIQQAGRGEIAPSPDES